MNVDSKIEELQKEIDKLKEELSKPEFEVGDWVIDEYGTILRITQAEYKRLIPDDICVVGHGIWRGENWRGEESPLFVTKSKVRKATPLEVEEALIKEAKRRYKTPCKIKYLDGKESQLRAFGLTYEPESDRLTASSRPGKTKLYDVVYEKGEWAEVVEKKSLKVFDWVAEDKGDDIKIGCHFFDKTFLRDFIEVLEYVEDRSAEEILSELYKLNI